MSAAEMHTAGPVHRVLIEIRDGWVAWSMECPHDPHDQTRPCWPHNEDTSPFDPGEAGALDCVWRQWFDENPEESLMAGPTIVLPVADADWTGDGFLFDLRPGAFRPEGGDR